jgi:carbonic anhydrase
MSDGSKQFMAWTLSIGLSATVYGGGAYWLKKTALHHPESDHHTAEHGDEADGHSATLHQDSDHETHGASHAKTEHVPDHHASKDGEHKTKHAENGGHKKNDAHHEVAAHEAPHGSDHDAAKGEHSVARAGHDAPHAPDHGSSHSAADHGDDHANPKESNEHAGHDAKPADKNAHSAPHWTYTKNDSSGPSHWGDLAKNFSTCEKGLTQSPIDIGRAVTSKIAPKIIWHYGTAKVNVENNGHTIQSNLAEGKNHITIDGDIYNLAQFHFHAPSEHRISGIPSDLELHFVHKNSAGGLAVIGVMLNEQSGRENKSFKPVWDIMPRDLNTKAAKPASILLTSLLPAGRQYFHYQGSLTTPPCSEGVRWFVLKEPVTMSSGQIEMYSSIFGGPTNRPVQPLQGREIITNGPPALAH